MTPTSKPVKRMAVKKSWACKACGEDCGDMGALKKHYAEYPDHNPAPQRSRGQGFSAKQLGLNYCPVCGTNMKAVETAIKLAKTMKV